MGTKLLPVSIIIPCGSSFSHLKPLIQALFISDYWPKEIILIDSALSLNQNQNCWQRILDISNEFKSVIRILPQPKRMYPGSARNEGCRVASQEWIAFLDVNTIPPTNWLIDSYSIVVKKVDKRVLVGNTKYIGLTNIQKIFITATYGELPIRTIPGTIIHRSILGEIGLFLPAIRAAEDTDWLVRAEYFSYIEKEIESPTLIYSSIPKNLIRLSKKWFRNYSSCAHVVFHLEFQKLFYVIFSNTLLLYIAFTWNNIIAKWDQTSIFYIANLTKISLFCILLFYFMLRGIAMPLRRGTKLKALIPFRWIPVGITCIFIDTSKLIAYIFSIARKVPFAKKVVKMARPY